MEKHQILVVEDDHVVRQLIAQSLGDEGFALREAEDGEVAWAAIRDAPPDVVVCDYEMPRMDGVELIRRIKADPTLSTVATLLLTGHTTLKVASEGLAAGADDYTTKPFDPDDLRLRVQTLIRRRHRNRRRTSLPSGPAILKAIDSRIGDSARFATVYITLEPFGSFLYKFGFHWSATVLQRIAELLRATFSEFAGEDAFVGHVTAEHFVAVCGVDRAAPAYEAFAARLDEMVSEFYEERDVARRRVLAVDRFGMPAGFSLLHATAVVVKSTEHRLGCTADVARVARSAMEARKGSSGRSGSTFVQA